MCSARRFLKICNPNIAIQRGFAVPQGFAGLVFDIGDGPFDHHAKNSPVRENGVPYAAFGLLWRELGPQLVGPWTPGRFDESFVQPLDLDDNTGCGNQLANIIAAYNPRWDGEDRPDDCFAQAVALAQDMLASQAGGHPQRAARRRRGERGAGPHEAAHRAALPLRAVEAAAHSQQGAFCGISVPAGRLGGAGCARVLWLARAEGAVPRALGGCVGAGAARSFGHRDPAVLPTRGGSLSLRARRRTLWPRVRPRWS